MRSHYSQDLFDQGDAFTLEAQSTGDGAEDLASELQRRREAQEAKQAAIQQENAQGSLFHLSLRKLTD